MPKFKKFRSERLVNINTAKFAVDWSGECRSKFQRNVKQWLERYWCLDIVVEEMPMPGTRCLLDLVNLTKKIVVETNGKQHTEFNPYFHAKNRWNFHGQILRDESKREWAEANGFIFVEIYDTDLPLTTEFFLERYKIHLHRVR